MKKALLTCDIAIGIYRFEFIEINRYLHHSKLEVYMIYTCSDNAPNRSVDSFIVCMYIIYRNTTSWYIIVIDSIVHIFVKYLFTLTFSNTGVNIVDLNF